MQEGKESRKYYFLVLSTNPKYKSAIFGEQTARGIGRIWRDVSIHTVRFFKRKPFLWAALSYSTYDGNTIDLLPSL